MNKSFQARFLLLCVFFSCILGNLSQTAECESVEWTCSNGECISANSLCNGKTDCSDGSDETVRSCSYNICPEYAFQCDYGACVDSVSKCDGIQDCADNSDEEPKTCPLVEARFSSDDDDVSTRQQGPSNNQGKSPASNKNVSIPLPQPSAIILLFPSDVLSSISGLIPNSLTGLTDIIGGDSYVGAEEEPPEYCKLPNLPEVIIKDKTSGEVLEPGQLVNSSVAITYKCRAQHILDGPKINICRNGYWINDQAKCTRYCSGLQITGITIQAKCEFAGSKIECNENVLRPGTKATISCRTGYRKPEEDFQEILTCKEDGEWDNLPTRCDEICGTIQQGPLVNNTNFLVPWHVAIFRRIERYQHVCGGTILNARVVISAAHCYWNLNTSEPIDISQYTVAAGKTRYHYFANDPQKPQFFNLTALYLPPSYKDGAHIFQNDIALLVLNKPIDFKPYIRPVCLDWQLISNEPLKPDLTGRVGGWGVKFRSKGLRTADIPVVSFEECTSEADPKYKAAYTGDKFCVGKSNETCVLEGGGGFVALSSTSNVDIYYLRGVVSHGINFEEICSNTFYVAVTNVQLFSGIISEYVFTYGPRI